MISEKEAQYLMDKFIYLREKSKKSKDLIDIREFQKHEAICIRKFKYLVEMRTNRYKGFSNYDDLNQEGLEALVKAMKNYNPKLGIFFWWAHKYIETRIARSANLHTTIRYPLKFAKNNTPHKESSLPILIESRYCPDENFETAEISNKINIAISFLNDDQKRILFLAYGFNGDKPLSINKICKKMNISRLNCVKTINSALNALKQNIHL